MRGRPGLERSGACAVVVACLVAPGIGAAATAPANQWPQVRIGDTFVAAAVRMAISGAARRLGRPHCAGVFSSPWLRDPEGRLLQARLDEMDAEGAEYLGRLSFYDAGAASACRHDEVMAFTTPGGHGVFVCGRRFLDYWQRSPARAEFVIIHEALHTLGLGENPPSSLDITGVVKRHCNR